MEAVDFVKPSEAIARVGLRPEDVTDLIISHAPWDHAGGVELFPKGRTWIQKDELEYYAGICNWCDLTMAAGVPS